MPVEALLGKPPRMRREVASLPAPVALSEEFAQVNLREALYRCCACRGGGQDFSHHHRRPYGRRPRQP